MNLFLLRTYIKTVFLSFWDLYVFSRDNIKFPAQIGHNVILYCRFPPVIFSFVSVDEYKQECYTLNEKDCYSFWLMLDADTMQSRWGADCMPHGSTEDVFYTVGGNFRGVPWVPRLQNLKVHFRGARHWPYSTRRNNPQDKQCTGLSNNFQTVSDIDFLWLNRKFRKRTGNVGLWISITLIIEVSGTNSTCLQFNVEHRHYKYSSVYNWTFSSHGRCL
jgi:hypothetical protein